MEFKGTKSILTMPCGATSGTNQDRPSNVVYSKGKILAKFYGETPEEATANAKIFTCNQEMLEQLKESLSVISWYMDNTKPEGNQHSDFFNIGMNQRQVLEDLILKATE